MAALPAPLQDLAAALSRLPGIGPRSAERLALFLAQSEPERVRELAQALLQARERVQRCAQCGALTEQQPCAVCQDPKRDPALLCLLEKPADLIILEKSGAFRGKYHVLGGKLSPLNGIGPDDLNIAALERRFDAEPIRELILALPSDVEGDATCRYLAQRWSGRPFRISRLAQGLPVGGGLEYADELTLSQALEGRRPV